MEKEQNSKTEEKNNNKIKSTSSSEKKEELKEKEVELSPEDKIKELDSVKTYYECSNAKAEQILKILTKEQLNFIKSKLDIGGRQ